MPPTTIYHYTGLDPLLKIVESGRIRATHYGDFADKDELRLGVRLLLDAVKKQSIDSHDRKYRDFLVEGIEGFANGQLQVFVLSLTELEDSRFHWQTYANQGVAIGFCRDRVQQGFPIDISNRVPDGKIADPVRPDPANRFMQCRYVSNLDLPHLVSARFFAVNSYPAMFRNAIVRDHGMFAACLSVSIYQTICAIKGDGYFEDAEWRCVHINPNPNEYPMKQEGNRRFIEMQFDPALFIRELWIGPHNCRQECNETVERLRKKGLLTCSTIVSGQ